MRLILLTGLLLVTGCDFTYRMIKPGVSQEQIREDQYQCKQESITHHYLATGAVASAGSSSAGDLIECMEARGYRVRVED